MTISWWIPILPPSSNKIYIRHPWGRGRILSGQARAFKIKAIQAIQENSDTVLKTLRPNVPYELKLAIFFPKVKTIRSNSKLRYTKIDISNRIKLIEDVVAEAVGLDDSHNFRIIVEKHCDPKNPGIWVSLRELPEEEVGLTKVAYEEKETDSLRLRQPQQNRTSSARAARWFLGKCPSRNEQGGPDSSTRG